MAASEGSAGCWVCRVCGVCRVSTYSEGGARVTRICVRGSGATACALRSSISRASGTQALRALRGQPDAGHRGGLGGAAPAADPADPGEEQPRAAAAHQVAEQVQAQRADHGLGDRLGQEPRRGPGLWYHDDDARQHGHSAQAQGPGSAAAPPRGAPGGSAWLGARSRERPCHSPCCLGGGPPREPPRSARFEHAGTSKAGTSRAHGSSSCPTSAYPRYARRCAFASRTSSGLSCRTRRCTGSACRRSTSKTSSSSTRTSSGPPRPTSPSCAT